MSMRQLFFLFLPIFLWGCSESSYKIEGFFTNGICECNSNTIMAGFDESDSPLLVLQKGDNQIWKRMDLHFLDMDDAQNFYFDDLAIVNESIFVFLYTGTDGAKDPFFLLFSHDCGENWMSFDLHSDWPEAEDMKTVGFYSKQKFFVELFSDSENKFFFTNDSGATWELNDSLPKNLFPFTLIYGPPGTPSTYECGKAADWPELPKSIEYSSFDTKVQKALRQN